MYLFPACLDNFTTYLIFQSKIIVIQFRLKFIYAIFMNFIKPRVKEKKNNQMVPSSFKEMKKIIQMTLHLKQNLIME